MTEMNLSHQIEAMIFTADRPASSKFLAEMLTLFTGEAVSETEVIEEVERLNASYDESGAAFRILPIAGGFKLLTREMYDPLISFVHNNSIKKKLTRANLETLSIIVYKQPVTKSYIESIRGVNSDYAIHKLLEKGLAKILGQSDEPGRPLLYGAGEAFLEHFGLNDFSMLPKLKEPQPIEQIGRPLGEEE